ncbi:MAG: XdhC family protein [Candidatus Hodarchaeales archaeon]|jgi:xanthine dehydrogenase accessory factor
MKSDFSSELHKALDKHSSIWVVTVVHTSGSTPRKVGAKMIVNLEGELLWGTIGGGNVERIASQVCTTLKEAKLISYDIGEDEKVQETTLPTGMICGGTMSLFYESIGGLTIPNVWIYGSGHCGKAVYNILTKQDWNIIMLDNREEVLISENFPNAERRIGKYEELADSATYSEKDYILIMTQGHISDEYILRSALKKKWKYLGMMGSTKKVKEKMDLLKNEGFSEDLLNKVNAPIGFRFGGQSPEEIAIDIVAKLLQVRYADIK